MSCLLHFDICMNDGLTIKWLIKNFRICMKILCCTSHFVIPSGLQVVKFGSVSSESNSFRATFPKNDFGFPFLLPSILYFIGLQTLSEDSGVLFCRLVLRSSQCLIKEKCSQSIIHCHLN